MPSPRRAWAATSPQRIAARAARRGLRAADAWFRSRTFGRLTTTEQVAVVSRAVRSLRWADRATRYRVSIVHGAHLQAIVELFDLADYGGVSAAASDVVDDCSALGDPDGVPALRARGERARSLLWSEGSFEAIDEFVAVLAAAGDPPSIGAPWQLSFRFCLALARRDAGQLDRSTLELRGLVPDMVTEFGQDSAWMVATVVQLAQNIRLSGDVDTAVEMLTALLSASTRLRGPLGKEALTLRSKVARWTLEGGDMDRGLQAAAATVIDFTRAGLSSCTEALELRFDYAESLFDDGEVDYATAQLASLRADLEAAGWTSSPFAASVRATLDEWLELTNGDEGQH